MNIAGKYKRFLDLSSFERRIVLEAFGVIALTRAALALAGFRRWKSILTWTAARKGPQGARLLAVSARAPLISKLESAAARNLFFQPNCLEKSMALWWLLQRHGIAADLRVGARKEAGKFEAHAWVESGGVVFDEAGHSHLGFAPFESSIVSAHPHAG